MSDSLMAFQPAIDEPSNIVPSAKKASSIRSMSSVRCCILPRGSVKRRSTNLTSSSAIIFLMVEASDIIFSVNNRINCGWFIWLHCQFRQSEYEWLLKYRKRKSCRHQYDPSERQF